MKFLKLFLLVTTFLSADFANALNKGKFIDASEAFKVSVEQKGEMIETQIKLADHIHVTPDSLKFIITKPKKVLLDIALPKPKIVDGDEVYEDEVVVNIPIKQIWSKVDGDYTLTVEYAGCSSKGICYNAMQKSANFKGDPNAKVGLWAKIMSLTDESNPAGIVDVLAGESSFFIVLLFFVLGLLLAMTPCIFPMIPILSSIIVSKSGNEAPSASKGFFISLVYVLSMAITYTAVGVISGMLGADIQAAMQNPWVLSGFTVMFFALAISLFGYYELQLPASWQSKINSVSDGAQGKGIFGTVVMGFLSAFIIGPCVAPPLAGAVIFISQTGDALLGGIALFAMSIGMGLPLLIVGIGAGKFMPRPGGWMTTVSQTFGVVMLGLAIFMLGKVVPASVTILLWSFLLMGTALYMGVFNDNSTRYGTKKLTQLLALVFLVYGVSLFIGYISGAKSVLHPFKKFTSGVAVEKVEHIANGGYSLAKLQKEVASSEKIVLVDFRKKSCASCDELEELTFPNAMVKEELKRFTFITIDVTANSDAEKALQKKYRLFGTPSIIFFDKENKFLPSKSLSGFLDAKKLTKHLKSIH